MNELYLAAFFIRSQYVELLLKRGYILILKCFGETSNLTTVVYHQGVDSYLETKL